MMGRMWLGRDIRTFFINKQCIYCNGNIETQCKAKVIEKNSSEQKYYNFDGFGSFKVRWKNYFCIKCGREIEDVTLISYNAFKKYCNKINKILMSKKKVEVILEKWIDESGKNIKFPSFDDLSFDNKYLYVFVIKIKDEETKFVLAVAKRTMNRVRPYKIYPNKKVLKELKQKIDKLT